jgi:hypothetical protein
LPDSKTFHSWFKLALPVVLAIGGIGTLGALTFLSRGAFAQVSDFPEFYAPMKMIVAGAGSQIYVIEQLSRIEQFYYPSARAVVTLFTPPFGLPYFLPLAALSSDIAPAVWKAFLAASLFTGIAFLRAAFKLNITATCWLTAVLCFSGCAYEALRIDQVSTPIFMCFSIAIWALKNNRPYLAAFALSGMLCKPQEILPFIIFLVGVRRYKTVGALAVIGLILMAAAYVLIGKDGFANYSELIKNSVTDTRYLVSDISCTVRGQLYRLFPQHRLECHYFSLAVLLPSLAACLWLGNKVRHFDRWLEYGLVAVMPLGIVSSLYCYYYDLLILVPAAVLLMTVFEPELPPLGILAGMIGGLAFMLPFSIFIHLNWILEGKTPNPHFFILLAFAIGSLAFIAGKIKSENSKAI